MSLDLEAWESHSKQIIEHCAKYNLKDPIKEYHVRILSLISELRKFQANSIRWDTICSQYEERIARLEQALNKISSPELSLDEIPNECRWMVSRARAVLGKG